MGTFGIRGQARIRPGLSRSRFGHPRTISFGTVLGTLVARCNRLLAKDARVLRIVGRNVSDTRYFALVRDSPFRPIQQESEILALVALLRSGAPRSIVEIGTANGGTGLLLARALTNGSSLVTIDLSPAYDEQQLRRAHSRTNDVHLVVADSQDLSTPDLVRTLLPDGCDAILIDGDHSYSGVRLDTLRFLPLVRPGGIVAFHDIQSVQADDPLAYKKWVGGVPDWWQQVISCVDDGVHRFVTSDDQSGYGIGAIELPHDPAALADVRQRLADLPHLPA